MACPPPNNLLAAAGCQLRFATIDPASVETSETPRKFGEPKPMAPEKPAAVDNDVALAQIEAACDGLKAEVATIKQELHAARDERDRLLDLVAALVESHFGKSTLLQRSETAEAEVVLAAKERVERLHSLLPKRSEPEGDQRDRQ